MTDYAGEANMVIQPFSPMLVTLPVDSASLVERGVLTARSQLGWPCDELGGKREVGTSCARTRY